jgi:hypothetical protein
MTNTCTRMAALECRLANLASPVTLERLEDAFRSSDDPNAPVSKHANKEKGAMAFTAGCVIFEIPTDGDPVAHVSAGPPDIEALATFTFTGP